MLCNLNDLELTAYATYYVILILFFSRFRLFIYFSLWCREKITGSMERGQCFHVSIS